MSAKEINLLVESNKRILNKLDGFDIRFDTIERDLVEVKNDLIEVKDDLVEVKDDLVEVKNDLIEVKNDLVEVKDDLIEVKNGLSEVKSNLNKVLAFVSIGNEDVVDKLAKSKMKKVSN